MAAGKRPAAVLDAGHVTHQNRSNLLQEEARPDRHHDGLRVPGHALPRRGSFGAVLKARHRVTSKTVAIKVLRSTDDPAVANREIEEEAGFLEACAPNPYVVGTRGLFRDPITRNLCLAMDYVGPNLRAFLSERPPLPEAIVKGFMWQLLTGANKMHMHHIIHRDIKPHNILVGEGGRSSRSATSG
ncbi:hypothetical protein ZWY2020_041203 [Hordeum vulgare]|nr:hypothetical protein ZWY2020_041203 [Hordeum vulgare]